MQQDVAGIPNLCEYIHFPVSKEKTEWATQIIVFLGILVNTCTQTISIPLEKRMKALQQIKIILNKKKVTVLRLQRITGLLNYMCKGIVPGRCYTRQIYSKFKGMKQYHHAKVDTKIQLDLKMWQTFFKKYESISRPFMNFNTKLKVDTMNWYTDTSGNLDLGCGGHFNDQRWFMRHCDKQFMMRNTSSIEYLELYALMLGVYLSSDQVQNRRIILFCDNKCRGHD